MWTTITGSQQQQRQQQHHEATEKSIPLQSQPVHVVAGIPVVASSWPIPMNNDKNNSSNTKFHTLPQGWTTVVHETDGRIYYYNNRTGQTSWVHPLYNPATDGSGGGGGGGVRQNNNDDFFMMTDDNKNNPYDRMTNSTTMDTPFNASRRPDSQQSYAFISFLLCPPIGMIALYHSIMTDRMWDQGKYSKAVQHAREAPKFACSANTVGIIFWIYYFFFRKGNWEWPDIDFSNLFDN